MEFEDATEFKSGYAGVKNAGKWAIMDTTFNLITGYVYDYVGSINENDLIPIAKDGLSGYIDSRGTEIYISR